MATNSRKARNSIYMRQYVSGIDEDLSGEQRVWRLCQNFCISWTNYAQLTPKRFFLLVGKPIQRSEEDKFLFQGDIAMPRIDVMKTLRNRRRKRAVMRKISTGSNLWQTHKLAYIFRNDLGREYTFTSC